MRELAQHALELSPDLAGAHAALQYFHLTFWDWKAAETEGDWLSPLIQPIRARC